MKKKLLTTLSLGLTALISPSVISLSSCSNTLIEEKWNRLQEPEHDIAQYEGELLSAEQATTKYFDEISKNPKLFIQDFEWFLFTEISIQTDGEAILKLNKIDKAKQTISFDFFWIENFDVKEPFFIRKFESNQIVSKNIKFKVIRNEWERKNTEYEYYIVPDLDWGDLWNASSISEYRSEWRHTLNNQIWTDKDSDHEASRVLVESIFSWKLDYFEKL